MNENIDKKLINALGCARLPWSERVQYIQTIHDSIMPYYKAWTGYSLPDNAIIVGFRIGGFMLEDCFASAGDDFYSSNCRNPDTIYYCLKQSAEEYGWIRSPFVW